MTTLLTVLRGLRSRALLSATTLAMMVLAVSGAVLGPMFQQASTQSYALTRLDETPDPVTALSWQAASAGTADLSSLVDGAREEAERVAPATYAAPQVYVVTDPLTRPKDGAQVRFLSRDDACATLDVEGRCPEAPGEVLVHVDDLKDQQIGGTVDTPRLGPLTIVGTYTTPDSTDDWLFPTLLASQPATPSGDPYRPGPFFVTEDAVASLPPGLWSPQLESRLLVPDTITEQQLDDLVTRTETVREDQRSFAGGVLVGTARGNALRSVVAEIRGQTDAARAALAPAVVSLVLVALAMILRLQLAAADLRGSELALAALRGVGRRRAWVLGLAEPWLLVLVSLPLGVLGGYAATRALAVAWLRDGTSLALPTGSLLGAVGVGVAMLVIAAAAIGRGLRETLGSRLTGTQRPQPSGRVVLVVELVVVLLAATLPLSVLGSDKDGLGAADLLLPVAAAVAAGLLMTRAVTAVAVWWTGRGAERPLPVFVAARAVARRSQGTLVILPVCAAVAVAVFAVGTDSAASAWRGSVAATTAPGVDVYESPRQLDETMHLTERLDPDGRYLMAVAEVAVPSAGEIVAVDSSRLDRVGDWPGQWLGGRTGAEAAALVAPAAPVLRLEGTTFRVSVDDAPPGAEAVLGLRTPVGRRSVDVAPGTDIAIDACSRGCFLTSVGVTGIEEDVTVSALTVDGESVGLDPVIAGPDAPWVTPAAARPLPVLVGVAEDGKLLDGTTLATASETLTVRPRGTAESLPLVGAAGILVDLASFVTQSDPAPILVVSYVAARADTPASLREELSRAGLTRSPGSDDIRRVLDRTAYAQALRLYLVVAAVLLLMALGGLLVSNAVQLPARRRDAASLRVVGVPRRSLVVASLAEYVVVLGSAAVAGLASGAAALAVLLPSLELGVVDDPRTPRVLPDPDVGRLVLVSAGVTAVLLLVAVLTAVSVVSRARAATLRETAG